ncbi:MAG: hypothetical protein ACTJH9_04800 [Pseudoalteromonas sp.]|uniref:hypothetical protein n=1 Tax=unclassified Pseudoalteromonas TaxID=194690 RepID=UPI003F9D0584
MSLLDDIARDIVASVFRNHKRYDLITVFAKYLGYKAQTVHELAMGALLHDLCQPKLPLDIFYNVKYNHYITAKDVDLSEGNNELKIIASIKSLDHQINLARLLKEHLLI